MTIHVHQPSIAQVRAFRKEFLAPSLVYDHWDDLSKHYAISSGDQLLAIARMTHAFGNLPFCDEADVDYDIELPSVELGRVVVDPHVRKMSVLALLMLHIIEDLSSNTSAKFVYVDGIAHADLSYRSLERFGFKSVGISYYDHRYKARSRVFISTLANLVVQIRRRTALLL